MRSSAFLRFALLLALATPAYVRAADEPKELEERTSSELEKLKPLLDSKNWDGALNLLLALDAKVRPESYDKAFLADIIGKLYLQKGDYGKAIGPLEQAVKLGDAHNFFEPNQQQESIFYLAQLYYQEATTPGMKDRALQLQYTDKAISYVKRWMAASKKPPFDQNRVDALALYANMMYFEATVDPKNVNKEKLKEAEHITQEALRSASRPKENLYIILLAIYQQEENYPALADLLELLVKQFPNKKDNWASLAGVYSQLAANEKDDAKQRAYNIRTILTIERAQSLGLMTTPKDNYSLFGLYFNIGQFTRATDLLQTGLRDGSIESDLKNWELLASSFQQADRPVQAIEALKEGSKHFPKSGELDYQAATIYYSLNKPEDSYRALQTALSKGNFEKPGAVYGFLAYVAWELNKFEEASAAVDKALSFPDSKKDTQLPKLKNAIEGAIRERDAQKTAGKSA